MKYFIIVILALFIACSSGFAQTAKSAKKETTAKAKVVPEFEKFWKDFQLAVKNKDKSYINSILVTADALVMDPFEDPILNKAISKTSFSKVSILKPGIASMYADEKYQNLTRYELTLVQRKTSDYSISIAKIDGKFKVLTLTFKSYD